MGISVEAIPARSQWFRSSALKKPIVLARRDSRLVVEPDASVRCLESLSEGRLLFGREQVWFYKVQAGVIVQAPRPEWALRATPGTVSASCKIFDGVEVVQSLEPLKFASVGYVRRVRIKNQSAAPLRLRVLNVRDPTAAHFSDRASSWGSLGVNAFNRGSHVAMDEVSEPPAARVVGSTPSPLRFYMTTDKRRALELAQGGDVPDAQAGMSGQVLVLSLHEFELSPSEATEVSMASLYNPGKLEDALSDFGRVESGAKPPSETGPRFACSNQHVSSAFAWATSALGGAKFEADLLDRVETLRGLPYVDPAAAEALIETARRLVTKDGSLPHSLDGSLPGVLESSVLLSSICAYAVTKGDKKYARALHPLVKKLAAFLLAASKGDSVGLDSRVPQGWRRHIGRGAPAGEVPEVTLSVASGLYEASRFSRLLGKTEDAGRFRERAEMINERARKRLVDERGFLVLSLDPSGKAHTEETVDQSIACYRFPVSGSMTSSMVHRLLEKDFETGYGPRTVPTTNRIWFSGSYGQGQLGGFWTRAALAHAMLCYGASLAGIGSLALQKVAKLVSEDSVKLGGSPGEFPYWLDVEAKELRGEGGDRVSAARFIECVTIGELGLAIGGSVPAFHPPPSSALEWALASDIWAGEKASVFVGRASGRANVFASCVRATVDPGMKFGGAESAESTAKEVSAVSFFGPGQLICLGNGSDSQVRTKVSFAPRAPELSKRLSTPLEEFDADRGAWTKVGTVRVFPTMSFEALLGPGGWKTYRISAT